MSTTTENEFVTSTGVLWDDPEEGKTWLVSLVSIAILCSLIVFLSVVYFRGEQAEVDTKIVDESWLALQKSKQSQVELLASAGPFTADVGGKQVNRERIPIAKAMEALAADPRLAVPPAGAATSAPTPAPVAPPAAAKPAAK